MLSWSQIAQMDDAVHTMAGAMQRLVIAVHGITDEKLRETTTCAVREFIAAKDAYRAAKEGSCTEVFCAPANGSEAEVA